ncbi:MAG: hypothetical protein Kow0069_20970 [Promethearchaeota archaeon]
MARKERKKKKLFEKKVDQIAERLAAERKEERRWLVRTSLIPVMDSAGEASKEVVNVKISVSIKDRFFYCRGVTVKFSAGTEDWQEAKMEPDKGRLSDSVDMDEWAIVLANIPIEIQVMFYLELLDKSGEVLVDDNEGNFYTFTTEPGGMIDQSSEWDDRRLVRCTVCGYHCQPTWEECPACNTPLSEFQARQEIFLDDQKKKEEELKAKQEDDSLIWEEAQQTDEIWRGLPDCPSCGYTVQPDWTRCPICNFDLTSVELKKKGIYEDEFEENDKEIL